MSVTADQMQAQGKKENVNKYYKWFIILPICIIIPLIVSAAMGGEFLQSLAGDNVGMVILRMMSSSIIFSGPVLAGICAAAWVLGYRKSATAGFLVVCVIVFFSTSTTTMSILKTAETKVDEQINESDTVVDARATIESNKALIASKQAQIDGRNQIRWAGKRDGWADEIRAMNAENKELRAEIKNAKAEGEGSPVAKSFMFMEEKFGITKGWVAVIAAFLMDAIPAVAMLILGVLGGRAYISYRDSDKDEDGKKKKGFMSRLFGKKQAA